MAAEKLNPAENYYGYQVTRRLSAPSKIPEAQKPDIFGRTDASPRQIEEVIFQTKRR